MEFFNMQIFTDNMPLMHSKIFSRQKQDQDASIRETSY